MKRNRIFGFDFDSRVYTLDPIGENWEEHVKQLYQKNQARMIGELRAEWGSMHFDQKLQNFKDLGAKPFSVVAFHNRLYSQCREAFILGKYYPALTGVCALGERVLNYLVLGLREHFKTSPLYKRIYNKDSIDNWQLAIDVLTEWEILTPDADANFRILSGLRNDAIHFNMDTEVNARALALEALLVFGHIVENQFAALGDLPWIFVTAGEIYVKKEYEEDCFIQLVYMPNTVRVGYMHGVSSFYPLQIEDDHEYEDRAISDEEYVALRQSYKDAPRASSKV